MTCNCGKPTRDDAYVCEDDLGELAKALGNIPWLVEQLAITMQGAKGIDYTTLGGSPASETPLPINQRAFEAQNGLRTALVTWTRFCDEEQVRNQSSTHGLPADDLVSMSRWLLWRVDGLGLNDLGWDAVSDITRAVGRCAMVVDRPAERTYAGPCECGRDLYAKPGAKATKCKSCEREYDVEEMRKWMQKATEGKLVTALEGSTLLGRFGLTTAQKTIDSWHLRKLVVDKGCSPEGRRLYLMDDLMGLAARHAAKSA